MEVEAPVIFTLPDKPTDEQLDCIIDEARITGQVTYEWLGRISILTIEQIEDGEA